MHKTAVRHPSTLVNLVPGILANIQSISAYFYYSERFWTPQKIKHKGPTSTFCCDTSLEKYHWSRSATQHFTAAFLRKGFVPCLPDSSVVIRLIQTPPEERLLFCSCCSISSLDICCISEENRELLLPSLADSTCVQDAWVSAHFGGVKYSR